MGRTVTLILLMSGISLLFYIGGLIHGTLNSTLLNLLLNPSQYQLSGLSLTAIAALGLAGTAAIAILSIKSGQADLAIRIFFGLYLLSLMADFLAVYNVVASTNAVLALLIFSPILVIWLITVVEFVGGTA